VKEFESWDGKLDAALQRYEVEEEEKEGHKIRIPMCRSKTALGHHGSPGLAGQALDLQSITQQLRLPGVICPYGELEANRMSSGGGANDWNKSGLTCPD